MIMLFILTLIGAVALLMLFILKFKIHPAISIFIVTLITAVLLGNTPIEAVNKINAGFGATLSSIGVVIILGSVIAVAIQDTGASISLANFFVRLVHGKNVELGPSLTACLLSIPVFGDITTLLMAPIAGTLAHKNKISMAKMAMFICLGLNISHALIPPTPGVLAITLQMGADLGMMIFWGTLIGLSGFFLVWLLMRNWGTKEFIKPLPTYILSEEKERFVSANTPSVFMSFLPLLVPVVLITFASFSKALLPKEHWILPVVSFMGDRVISLALGVVCAIFLVFGREDKIRILARENDPSFKEGASLPEIVLNSWIKRALQLAVIPLIVTAFGGAFGRVLAEAPASKELAEFIVLSAFPFPIFIPWLVATIMFTCLGSMTLAQLTTSALILPLLPALHLSPLAAVLAISAGASAPNHVNNSGFWVFSGFYNLNPKQGLKYITIPSILLSIILITIVAVLNSFKVFG